MKNILSYDNEKLISGTEIRDYILYHTTHNTSHTKNALKLIRYLNVQDYALYKLVYGYNRTRCKCKVPMFIRIR